MRLVVGIGVRRGGRISGITLWLFVAVVILGIIGRVYETRSSLQAVWSDTRTSLGDEFGAAPLLTVITAPRERTQGIDVNSTFVAPSNTTGMLPPRGFLFDANQSKFLYVHIGKTGGQTLDMVLRSNCLWHRNPRRHKKCMRDLESQGAPESMVSRKTIRTMHCFPRGDRFNMEQINGFLVTIRNPITRVISAFNTQHPANKKSKKPEDNTLPTALRQFYVDCFPTIEDLAVNLRKKDEGKSLNEPEQTCYELGVKVLSGIGSQKAAGHLAMNYAHYDRLVLSKYPGRDILALRTEHLWDDLSGVDVLLGGSGHFVHAGEAKTHKSETHVIRQGLSPSGTRTICCYLANELQIYEDLLRQAINLSPSEKASTISIVYEQCGISFDAVEIRGIERSATGSLLWKKWAASSPACPSQRRLLNSLFKML